MIHPEPIIFIHGLFQGLDAPSVARSLAPTPVLAPDLPGYGEDRHHDPGDISLGAAANAIHARMRSLGWDRAHLVGHSVGGAVAVVLADRYPGAVASIVSVEGNVTLKDAFWSQQLARMDARGGRPARRLSRRPAGLAGWLRHRRDPRAGGPRRAHPGGPACLHVAGDGALGRPGHGGRRVSAGHRGAPRPRDAVPSRRGRAVARGVGCARAGAEAGDQPHDPTRRGPHDDAGGRERLLIHRPEAHPIIGNRGAGNAIGQV